KNVKTPTLVVVGERDGECPTPQSYEFWHALKTLGVSTELVVYPGEGHMFRQTDHKRDVIERTIAWFERYLHWGAGFELTSGQQAEGLLRRGRPGELAGSGGAGFTEPVAKPGVVDDSVERMSNRGIVFGIEEKCGIGRDFTEWGNAGAGYRD